MGEELCITESNRHRFAALGLRLDLRPSENADTPEPAMERRGMVDQNLIEARRGHDLADCAADVPEDPARRVQHQRFRSSVVHVLARQPEDRL